MSEAPVPERRTLNQIEHHDWGPPPDDATSLIERCHRLRSVPVADLGADDLRMLLGQRIGVAVLVPLALGPLEGEPLLEARYYPGDLLHAVLHAPPAYWEDNPTAAGRLERVISSVPESDPRADRPVIQAIRAHLGAAPPEQRRQIDPGS